MVVEVSRCGVNFADTHATRNDYLAEQEKRRLVGALGADACVDSRAEDLGAAIREANAASASTRSCR